MRPGDAGQTVVSSRSFGGQFEVSPRSREARARFRKSMQRELGLTDSTRMSLPPVVCDALAILSASTDEEYEAAVQRAIASGLLWDGDDAPDPTKIADDVIWWWELMR